MVLKYFISYCAISNGVIVWGNADFNSLNPITTIEQITTVQDQLKLDQNLQDVKIVFIHKLDEIIDQPAGLIPYKEADSNPSSLEPSELNKA